MSEFEIASLDYQVATLAARHWANWIAGASAFIAVLQTGLVAWGIREMVRANRDRTRQTEAQTRAADQRHAENMRRLDALIEEQAEQRRASDAQTRALIEGQAEQRRASDALIEGQAEQRRASDAQTRALEALLERAAAKPPAA